MMKKVRDFIERYNMLTSKDCVIIGVSGGADSICLLFVLLELQKEMGYGLVVVHVNHGLRGKRADADEAFVKAICEVRGISCEIYRKDVESIAKKRKQSLEEAGRMVRRAAFEDALKKYKGTKIAMAHHKNDNAETLLMNMARGTGLKGVGGIRPVNGNTIRPLLCLERNEIEDFMQRNEILYCTDETNEEDCYMRNRVRHFLVPFLEEQVNRQAVLHLNELAEQMQMLQEYMDMQVDAAYTEIVAGSVLELTLKRKKFEACQPVIKGLLIRRCMEQLSGCEQDISRAHIGAVEELFGKQVGRQLDLPYEMLAVRNYDGVTLKQRKTQQRAGISPRKIQIPGVTRISEQGLVIHCEVLELPEKFLQSSIPQKPYTKWFDYDIIKNNVEIRSRQGGDFISIDKQGSTQKLKAYYINEKIPAGIRNSLPLIAEGQQILWIVGYRMSSAYQVSGRTKRVLQIQITEEKDV